MNGQVIVDACGEGIRGLTPGKFLFGLVVLVGGYLGLTGFCNRNATKQGHFFECKPLGFRSGPTAATGLYPQNDQKHIT